MPELNGLAFATARFGDTGPLAATPMVDDVSLAALAQQFGASRGFSPAGGYGGLIPSWFEFGHLRAYLLGAQEQQCPTPGHLWLLSCAGCGEAGCWPLTARVIVRAATVTWTDFAQDLRPDRDYCGFGPFVFARDQYEHAVDCVANEITADPT